MLVKHHILVTLIISSVLYFIFHSMTIAVSCFLSGIFIDLDHIPDYLYNFGRKGFSFRNVVNACRNGKYKKVFFFLHSYELLLIVLIILFFTKSKIWIGIFIGLAQHLFLDQLFNPVHQFSYFLFFRLRKNFQKEKILTN